MRETLRRLALWALFVLPVGAQAAIYQFNAYLSGTAERPTATASQGSGVATLFYDDQTNTYDFSIFASGLSGKVTAAHIHGQANAEQSAGARVDLLDKTYFENYSPAGMFLAGGADVPAPAGTMPSAPNGHPEQSFLAMLRSQLAYINIHTNDYPSGEIRGQLIEVTAVPEPDAWLLLIGGLGMLAFTLRGRVRAN